MGTNYFWYETAPCEKCGHATGPLHIGKSSVGWVFSLRIHPELGINDLSDWVDRFYRAPYIRDEYGNIVRPEKMVSTIMLRGAESPPKDFDYAANRAEPGPRNLIRTRATSQTNFVGRGSGTWDLFTGDFS